MHGPDVFSLLIEDHRRVEQLFSQFEQSQDPDVAMTICDELTVHAMLEEELVYPVLATKAGFPGKANEARNEHQEAKQLISQVDAGAAGGQDVSDLVRQLKESVQHHVEEEESEVFPAMKDRVPTLVDQIGNDVVERRKQLVEQVQQARSLNMPSRVVSNKPVVQ